MYVNTFPRPSARIVNLKLPIALLLQNNENLDVETYFKYISQLTENKGDSKRPHPPSIKEKKEPETRPDSSKLQENLSGFPESKCQFY